jgi:DNA sulfur modification protein DndB
MFNACADLVQGMAEGNLEKDADLARDFWHELAKHFPAWSQVQAGRQPASEVREGFVHGHGIALQAFGIAGNALLQADRKGWRARLAKLAMIDWSRTNTSLWEGRAMIGGRISKMTNSVILTTNVIKAALGLPLSEEEQRVEAAYLKGTAKRRK